MRTDRTWTGSINSDADNPGNWSPRGAPRLGNTLSMTQGVIDIAGNDLAGDTLSVSGISGSVEIDTREAAKLDLSTMGTIPVNVHVDGVLKLTAQVNGFFGEHVDFSGGTIRFIGTSTFRGSHTVFDGSLVGSASINVFHGANGTGASEFMEIDGSVGRRLTFNFESGGPPQTLQLDDPSEFHGTISLPPTLVGAVAIVGIHATRADLRDDILRLFDGNKLVDKVRLNGVNAGLNLEQNSLGVMLTQGASDVFQPGGPGTTIPLHLPLHIS